MQWKILLHAGSCHARDKPLPLFLDLEISARLHLPGLGVESLDAHLF